MWFFCNLCFCNIIMLSLFFIFCKKFLSLFSLWGLFRFCIFNVSDFIIIKGSFEVWGYFGIL